MPRGDAVQTRPTAADEMAKFTGFTSKDGETIDPKAEDLNPVAGKDTTPAEKEALARQAGDKTGKAGAAATGDNKASKPSKLTDEESEAAITALDAKLGREATDKEIADALAAAIAEKNKAAGGDSKKPARSVQDRINKSIRAQRAAERRAEAAEARADAAEAKLAQGNTAPLTGDTKKAKNDGDAPPDAKDFEFGELDANYMRALFRYEAKQEYASQSENQRKTQQTAQERKAAKEFEDQVTAFEEAGTEVCPDFGEVVIEAGRAGEYPLSDYMGKLLFGSDEEHRIEIAYMLASDVELATKVSKMPVERQLAWFGREQAKLSAGTGATEGDDKVGASEDDATKKVTQRKVSKAPAPVPRARGQGSNSSVPGDTTDFAAFEAAAMGRNKP